MVESIVESWFKKKFCFSHPIHLTFLPDIAHQMVFEWLYFGSHRLKLKVGVALKSVENNFRAWNQVKFPHFLFHSTVV